MSGKFKIQNVYQYVIILIPCISNLAIIFIRLVEKNSAEKKGSLWKTLLPKVQLPHLLPRSLRPPFLVYLDAINIHIHTETKFNSNGSTQTLCQIFIIFTIIFTPSISIIITMIIIIIIIAIPSPI